MKRSRQSFISLVTLGKGHTATMRDIKLLGYEKALGFWEGKKIEERIQKEANKIYTNKRLKSC